MGAEITGRDTRLKLGAKQTIGITMAAGTIYQATEDIFVAAFIYPAATAEIQINTDTSTPPIVMLQESFNASDRNASICGLVTKDDYWQITVTAAETINLYTIPFEIVNV